MAGYPFAEKTAAMDCPNGCTPMSFAERDRRKQWRELCRIKYPVNQCNWHHCTADFGLTARMDRAFAAICKASPVLTEEGKFK